RGPATHGHARGAGRAEGAGRRRGRRAVDARGEGDSAVPGEALAQDSGNSVSFSRRPRGGAGRMSCGKKVPGRAACGPRPPPGGGRKKTHTTPPPSPKNIYSLPPPPALI